MSRKFPLQEIPSGPDPKRILGEIRKLYFETSAATIERDFDRAIDLLKSLAEIDDRQKAHVYMEGLAEMRKEWSKPRRPKRGRV
jgi:hypothetical protein